MTGWKTVASGIRVREHPTRRHGARADRYYTLRFTVNGKQTEEALGWSSDGWTLGRAQEELGRIRAAGRTGQGPATLRERRAQHRDKQEAETTRQRSEKNVADLWERYSREIISANKPSTAAEKTRWWLRRIEPVIGKFKIKDVTEEDCSAIVRSPLRLDADGRITGGKAEAGNLYRLLHHLFAKALIWKLRPRELGNPLEGIDEPKAPRRERLLTAGEVTALLRALDEAEAEHRETPQIVVCIRAVILTGARISELLNLRWDDIRADEMVLHLTDTKVGFSRRIVSAEALALLLGVERVPGSPWVFRSARSSQQPLVYDTIRKAFDRIAAAAGVKGCTLHTVRHWFATATANSVSNPRVGMMLTGHRSTQAYLGYVHSHKEQAVELANKLGALVTTLGQGKPNVLPLPKARG
jgi:integrase